MVAGRSTRSCRGVPIYGQLARHELQLVKQVKRIVNKMQ